MLLKKIGRQGHGWPFGAAAKSVASFILNAL